MSTFDIMAIVAILIALVLFFWKKIAASLPTGTNTPIIDNISLKTRQAIAGAGIHASIPWFTEIGDMETVKQLQAMYTAVWAYKPPAVPAQTEAQKASAETAAQIAALQAQLDKLKGTT